MTLHIFQSLIWHHFIQVILMLWTIHDIQWLNVGDFDQFFLFSPMFNFFCNLVRSGEKVNLKWIIILFWPLFLV